MKESAKAATKYELSRSLMFMMVIERMEAL